MTSVYGLTGRPLHRDDRRRTELGRGHRRGVGGRRAPLDRWQARTPRSPCPAWWVSRAGRYAWRWSRTSVSTLIDDKNDDLHAALKEHCPKRVNVDFDNVGGPILDAVLGRLAMNARVVLCGIISSYLTGDHPGPANYVNLLSKTATMQGFNALDQAGLLR